MTLSSRTPEEHNPDRDPHVLLGRLIDSATDLCHLATANNADRVTHLEGLLWTLYEGLYGHRKAEGIDPFKTAVGGALEVNKAWKERGSIAPSEMREQSNAAPQELPAVSSASRQATGEDAALPNKAGQRTAGPVRDSAQQPAGAAPFSLDKSGYRDTSPSATRTNWTPVSDGLPKPGEKVLAFVDRGDHWTRRIRAFYTAAHTVQADEETINNECADYVEAEDEFYLKPGWYEENEYDENYYFVGDPVTHWMPLPNAPESRSKE